MASFHKRVRLDGYKFEKTILTWKLAAGITAADVGKAVSLDTSVDNQVKLAADGDTILGRLETYESVGQLGAVEHQFAATLPIKTGLAAGEVVVRGSTVVGAGAGEVKARTVTGAATPDHNINYVAEVRGTLAIVVKI